MDAVAIEWGEDQVAIGAVSHNLIKIDDAVKRCAGADPVVHLTDEGAAFIWIEWGMTSRGEVYFLARAVSTSRSSRSTSDASWLSP